MDERCHVDELNNSRKRVCIATFISADFSRKHNKNRTKPFTATFHNVLDCHVNEGVFARCLFSEFRLNSTEVVGNQLNNLIKTGHNIMVFGYRFSVNFLWQLLYR